MRRPVFLVVGATFLFWTSLYLYVPVLPLHARALEASSTMIGVVVASYAIGQITLRIPIGIASDRWGRKPFAVLATVLSAGGAIWLGVSPDPWSLFFARALTGVAGAGWVAISVLYSSYFAGARVSTSMALIMGVNSGAVMLATFVGGLVSDAFGVGAAFYGSAGVGVAAALMFLAVPEPIIERSPISMTAFRRIARTPLLIQVSLIAITFQFVTFAVNFGFLPVLAEDLGATKSEIGYITTAGLAAQTAGTLVSAVLVARFANRGALLVASVAVLVTMVLLPFTGDLVAIGALQGLGGLGRGILNTVCIGLAVRSATREESATAMGAYQATYAIGMLTGPLVAGPIVGSYGIEAVFWLCAAMTVAGVGLVLARRMP